MRPNEIEHDEHYLRFEFDGRRYSARPGESVAQALLANGVLTIGRSAKYHRPRGMFCGSGDCGHCIARVNGRPNIPTCQTKVEHSMRVSSQNVLGSAKHDALSIVDTVFRKGLDHHHLMVEHHWLNRITVSATRKLAGLGTLPDGIPDKKKYQELSTPLLLVGYGTSAKAIANCLRGTDQKALVLAPHHHHQDTQNLRFLDALAVSVFDEEKLLAISNDTTYLIHFSSVVLALGTHPILAEEINNDLPGIFSLRAAYEALQKGIRPGKNILVFRHPNFNAEEDPRHGALLQKLKEAQISFQGLQPKTTSDAIKIVGSSHIDALYYGDKRFVCDALIFCNHEEPNYTLAAQLGVPAHFHPQRGVFLPECSAEGKTKNPKVFLAGTMAGHLPSQSKKSGENVAEALIKAQGESLR